MTLASLARSRSIRVVAAFLILIGGLVLIPGEQVADASGTPNVSFTKSVDSERLAGDTAIPITLTATNTTDPVTGTDGFNLTFVDVLQPGASFVSSTPAPTQILTNTPHTGETTLVWRNVADLQAGVTQSLTYTMSAGTLPVGTTITNTRTSHTHLASAHVNQDPRFVPTYNTGTGVVDNSDGYDSGGASTLLVPFILEKIEPNEESELLRGLHDHQTVYTLRIRNNHLGPTTDFRLRDWIPAGMEFLACGGDDNSTVGEEYTSSGVINPGNSPLTVSHNCIAPSTVDTVDLDPPGPLGSGVYTYVEWDVATLATNLLKDAVVDFHYVAAIPELSNTLNWAVSEPAENGPQASNIDNNNGASTQETGTEIDMTNGARAIGTYSGTSYFDDAEMTVSSEDLSIHKEANQDGITHGASTIWTLTIETSEYVGTASSIVVTDTVPDGLCPIGAGPECVGVGTPSPAYSSAIENGNGTWLLTWNVADMNANETVVITFPTVTRTHYQEGLANDTPVLANDRWTNNVSMAGNVDGRGVADISSYSQSAAPVSISKEVSDRQAATVDCAAVPGGEWNTSLASGYHVGDQVCWRLGVDFPIDLDTFDSDIQDYLPPGHVYTSNDSWALGSNNTVPGGDITGPTAANYDDTTLTWTVGDGGGYVAEDLYFEVVFSGTVVDATATTSGEIVENLMKYSYMNTDGTPFNLRDLADVEVQEAELDLVKGVVAVNAVSTGGSNNVDGVSVQEADVVTYQLFVTNSGDLVANDVELWDLLPAEYEACAANISVISDGGACAATDRIEWSGLSVPAGGSITVIYDATIPTGIAPSETLPNDAGVRSYTSTTNNGSGTFTYYPASNIDSGAPAANTTVADDPSSVITDNPTIDKTRTTSVDESGNAASNQATLGELITYTIDTVVPEGTTVYAADVVDDLSLYLDLVSSSHTFDGVGGNVAITVAEDTGTDTVTATFPHPYTNLPGSGDVTLSVTIVARVLDVPQNVHGVTRGNTATFAYETADGTPRSINDSIDTTIVEPQLGITKNGVSSIDSDDNIVGGELVDYTVNISNGSGRSMAHDLVVVDTLPIGFEPPTLISDGGVWNLGARTITWNIASLASGADVDRTYRVAVSNPIVVSTELTNDVYVDATSMASTPTGERTTYHEATDETMYAPLAQITKGVAPATATIGDVATYTIVVTIPPGTTMYDGTVIDLLPAGLGYDQMVSATCPSCSPNITVTDLSTVGTQSVGFWLDDVAASAGSRVVTIVYEAHVLNTLSRGATPDNAATVYGNQTDKIVGAPGAIPPSGPFDVNDGPAIATVTIVEPNLTIDKHVSGQVGDSDNRRALPGETLTYTLTVTNEDEANLSPAHDVVVVDTLALVTPFTVSGISDGGTYNSGTGEITWNLSGPIDPGASNAVALTYDVTSSAALDETDEIDGVYELINTADVTEYFGVAKTVRDLTSFTYIRYIDVDDDTVRVELDLASVGNYVWFDVDNDGVQDGGEPPLAGIDVTVTYLGLDGNPGGGDDEVHNVTTDINGLYLVDHLPGGSYTVVVDSTDIPAGMAPSFNLDGTLDHTWPGALGEAEAKRDVDFGYTGTGSIGDTVWFDQNDDGAIDGVEPRLQYVDVDVVWFGLDGVLGGGDDIAYSDTTDTNGNYLIEDLPAGNYRVTVDTGTLPTGMVATFDSDGGDDSTSDLTLGAGADDLLQDFGYRGTGSIGDFVWLDKNEDGNQDGGEPGLIGVPVQLTWPGEDGALGGGDDEVFLTTTNASGGYLFENLPPGEYQVDVLGGLAAAATNTFDEDDGTTSPDSSTSVNLGNGVDHDTADFGYNGTASIGDTVWWDMDGSRAQEAGEPGIPGVEITLVYAGLDGVLGNADDLTFTDTTDASGNYLFVDLPAGNYSVSATNGVPVGFSQTHDETGGLDETSLVTGLAVDEIHLTSDFGYNGTGSIGDYVFIDSNNDGDEDPGEPGIPNIDVQLTWYGPNGTLGGGDDVVLSRTTDAVGGHTFPNLPAGGYDVEIITATLPPGFTPTGDADGVVTPHISSLTLGDGEDNDVQDFGYTGGGSIGDTVWFDGNGDGVLDGDEYGLEGVDLDVTWAGPDDILGNGDDEVFSTTTDASGNYLVSNLPPGGYSVVVDAGTLPAGMAATFDEDGTLDDATTLTLGDGASHPTADFGYRGTGEIGDFVWLDLNGDGVQDAGELGISDQTVELTWEGPNGTLGDADDQVYAATTDGSGNYLFEFLPPGDYEVEVTGPIVGAAVNTDDEDGDDDSHTPVTLGDGASHLTADFGYQGSAELGDFVWLDLNGDGAQDVGEPGIAGVDVTVTWYGDDGVPGDGDDIVLPVYVTDGVGGYLATGLPDGDYGVEVTAGVPTGLVNSADEDSDLDNQTDVAGLTAGDSHLTADFGYAGTGSIGDTIWWDLDGDAAQGAGEPGFAAIDITLTWAGLDAIFGNADDAVFTDTTDVDGIYLFENLPPGDYQVVVDEADLPAGVAQSGDPDTTLDGQSAVTLGVAEDNLDQDFGYRGAGSVGDFIWYDLDNDGVQDTDEPGVAGVTVTVTYLGGDGVVGGGDDVAFTAVTDSAGIYTVPGLPSGFYSAVVETDTVPAGFTVSGDLDGGDPVSTLFSLGAAEDKIDVDYPIIGDASLSGTVWNDVDGDQVIDATEVGIPGITVIVTWDGPDGPVVIPVVSGPDGTWDLLTLPPGDYTVELDMTTVPTDMTPTTGTDESVTLPVGGHENVDFGLAQTVDLGSTVWIDTDGDGIVDPDESGVPNVTVNLYDEDGLLVGLAMTNGDGDYLFPGLAPGIYLVRLDPDTLPAEIRATFDRDGSPDLNTLVNLTIGNDILDANFGFQVGLPVTGFEVESAMVLGALFLFLGFALVGSSRIRRRRQLAS